MTNKNPETHTYDRDTAEAGWDSPKRAQRLVEDFVVPGTLVLDVGIGTAQAVKGYPERGVLVIGIDHDPAMIEAARDVTGVSDIRLGDINNVLPIEDLKSSVGVVQAIGVFEFSADLQTTLAELAACLKGRGVIVFTVETVLDESEAELTEHFPDPNITVFRHSLEEVATILEATGLNLLHCEEYGGYTRGNESVPYAMFLAQKHDK